MKALRAKAKKRKKLMNDKDFSQLQKQLGIKFKDEKLLKQAFVHRSYINENPAFGLGHNERLEFLGDAVLELAVTENLFKRFPDYDEGRMTSVRAALVNYQNMAKVARDIELEKYILMSRGEAKDTGRAREVILANAMEALIGALYLDQGYEIAKGFIDDFVVEMNLNQIIKNHLYRDPKSQLQEIVQEKLRVTPTYQVLEEWGPDHKKIFKSGAYFGEKLIAEGEGYSKQEAEVEAAKNALKLVSSS